MGWKAWTSAVHFICSSWLLLINFFSLRQIYFAWSSNLRVLKLASVTHPHTSSCRFHLSNFAIRYEKTKQKKNLLFSLFFFVCGGEFKRKKKSAQERKHFHSPLCQYYLLFTGLSLNRRRQIQSDPKLNFCFSKFRIIWNHSTVHTQFINMLKNQSILPVLSLSILKWNHSTRDDVMMMLSLLSPLIYYYYT